jgi:hypothetical protein
MPPMPLIRPHAEDGAAEGSGAAAATAAAAPARGCICAGPRSTMRRWGHRLGALLRRNRHLRKLVEVPETRVGALPRRALWPHALQFTGSFPHLAYRFLRHGNVVVVVAAEEEEDEGCASTISSMLTKKRRRRRLDRDLDGAASADEDDRAATQE